MCEARETGGGNELSGPYVAHQHRGDGAHGEHGDNPPKPPAAAWIQGLAHERRPGEHGRQRERVERSCGQDESAVVAGGENGQGQSEDEVTETAQ